MVKHIEPGKLPEADFMLVEYETLRASRQDLVQYGESRFNFFLAAISGAIVVLGLVSTSLPKLTAYLLGSFIFLSLWAFGWITYIQMVDRNVGIILYSRGMSRVRRYFARPETHDPGIVNYLILPLSDEVPPFQTSGLMIRQGNLFGLPTLVAVVNSSLFGVAFSLLSAEIISSESIWSLLGEALIGLLLASLAFLFHQRYYAQRMKGADTHFKSQASIRFGVKDKIDEGGF